MRLYELFQKEDKDNVTQLKPQTKGTKYPLFSKENAQKAYNEYYNGADVDTDIDIVGKDNKVYVIRQNRDGDSQHFDPGHWYLTDANNKIVDFESYPDPGELLHYHMASDFYPKDPDEIDENVNDWFDQDKFNKIFARRKKKNFNPAVRKYIDSKNWKLSTVNVADLDDQAIDDQFGRVIDVDPDVGVDLEEPIYVHADGKTILDGFHRVYQAKRVGRKVIPAFVPESTIQENQQLPQEVQGFVNSLTPDDVGVDTVGEYIVHYEGFTDQCNDGHNEESIDDVYADVYRDFDQRQGIPALVRGVAHDDLGCENNPVLYSVYKNVNENFADGKKKGKSRPGRVKRSGASCKGSVTSLRAKAKKYSGERGKMYHWCANMKGGKKKKKKTNEGLFDEMPLPTWMSHTSLEKMFRQEYGDQYGDYLAYMDLDSDDDAAMSSDFGDMALDIAKDHDIKVMNKFLSQMPVQFKVDDLRLDQGIQVWHLVQQPTTVH